jgi:hypothetical protein
MAIRRIAPLVLSTGFVLGRGTEPAGGDRRVGDAGPESDAASPEGIRIAFQVPRRGALGCLQVEHSFEVCPVGLSMDTQLGDLEIASTRETRRYHANLSLVEWSAEEGRKAGTPASWPG